MPKIIWSAEYELGIPVIDHQHRRIVDYINRLYDFDQHSSEDVVADVIFELIDYTCSHFAFEESLLEDANYLPLAIHQATHQAFTKQIEHLKKCQGEGQDVREKTAALLKNWLIDHILYEDRDYVNAVIANIMKQPESDFQRWVQNTTKKFFHRYH